MPNLDADLVLTGGRVFTADAAKSWAEALAVRDALPAAAFVEGEAVHEAPDLGG